MPRSSSTSRHGAQSGRTCHIAYITKSTGPVETSVNLSDVNDQRMMIPIAKKRGRPAKKLPHFDVNLSEKDQIAKLKAKLRSLQRQMAIQNDQLVEASEASWTPRSTNMPRQHDS